MAKSNSGPNWLVIILALLAIGTMVTIYLVKKQKSELDEGKGMTDMELQRHQFSKLNEDQQRSVVDANRTVLSFFRPF